MEPENARPVRFSAGGPLGYVLLAVVLLIAYANSFTVPFVFDDVESVLNNWTIRSFWDGSWLVPPADGPLGGRPLANLTFALNYTFAGISPVGYHAVNFGVHLVAAWVLFALLLRVLRHSTMPEGVRARSGWLALTVALLWAAHPVGTNVVTYVSQRTEGLAALCILMLLFTSWRWFERPDRRLSAVCAVVVAFAGMACKEGMIVAPVLVLLLDRYFFSNTFGAALRGRKRFYLAVFSSWLLFLVLWLSSKDRGVGLNWGVTWYRYALTECRVIFVYAKLIFWPDPLVFDHGIGAYRRYAEEAVYVLPLAGLVAGTLYLVWKKRLIGLCLAWFLLLLAPSSSVMPVALQPIGENRMYLAMAAPLALAVCLVFRWLRRGAWPVFALVLWTFVFLTSTRNMDYTSATRIWGDSVGKEPNNTRGYNNLGLSLMLEERWDEAERAFGEAMRLKSDWADPVSNRGNLALQRGRADEAEGWFRLALSMDPKSPPILVNLGAILVDRGELDEAESLYERALKQEPHTAAALSGQGDVLLARGKVDEAIERYQEALRLTPHLHTAHNNLGAALLRRGRVDEAMAAFRNAAVLKPNHAGSQRNYATMLAGKGDFSGAVSHYLISLRSDPNNVEARTNLGLALQMLGKRTAAEACYREALRRQPGYERARKFLEQLRSPPPAREAAP